MLVASGLKLLTEQEHHEGDTAPTDNLMLNICKKFVHTTNKLDGEKFFVEETILTNEKTNSNNNNAIKVRKVATPLLACLACIELSDLAFAVDSIPAVLGISKDPFIVYTSNIFAILGMRSLYILISRAVQSLKFIRPAVASVLLFVAAKMFAEYFHIEVSAVLSLVVIGAILSVGVIASLLSHNNSNNHNSKINNGR